MDNNGVNDPVVAQLFGLDVRFSARGRHFWAAVPNGRKSVAVENGRVVESGKTRVEGKTLDEIEKQIAATFVPVGKVRVMQFALSKYDTIGSLREPSVVEIKGFNIEQTRGRNAQKILRYVTDKGEVSVNTSFVRADDKLIEDVKNLRSEWIAAGKEFTLRAQALAGRVTKITAEEILEELGRDNVDSDSGGVSDSSGVVDLDIFRRAFNSDSSDNDSSDK